MRYSSRLKYDLAEYIGVKFFPIIREEIRKKFYSFFRKYIIQNYDKVIRKSEIYHFLKSPIGRAWIGSRNAHKLLLRPSTKRVVYQAFNKSNVKPDVRSRWMRSGIIRFYLSVVIDKNTIEDDLQRYLTYRTGAPSSHTLHWYQLLFDIDEFPFMNYLGYMSAFAFGSFGKASRTGLGLMLHPAAAAAYEAGKKGYDVEEWWYPLDNSALKNIVGSVEPISEVLIQSVSQMEKLYSEVVTDIIEKTV